MKRRKALGKGLSALIPEADTLQREAAFFYCPIGLIDPNPFQPRQSFSESELKEMAVSVREQGILTPLLVTKKGDRYQLIAGERRRRAAQIAGLERVPVVVREASGTRSLELALVENIHRKDLNPVEEATAYKRLLEETGITQEALAMRIGKERSTIANLLRILNLPHAIQKDIVEGKLTVGHARVLAGLRSPKEQLALRDAVIRRGLSVRQLEELVKSLKVKSRKKGSKSIDPYLTSLADQLKGRLGTRVEIKKQGKVGTIVIHFYSDEELDRLVELLGP